MCRAIAVNATTETVTIQRVIDSEVARPIVLRTPAYRAASSVSEAAIPRGPKKYPM
jgi:hypothetical protein